MNTCASVDWYEGMWCVLDAEHKGLHTDGYGITWDKGASDRSVYRVHGPWWPERGYTVGRYLRDPYGSPAHITVDP